MKSRTFRLKESSIEQLKHIAETRGETQTAAIQFAIQNCYSAIQDEIRGETDEKRTDESASPRGASDQSLDALIRQLDVKDKQISDLAAALVAAQDTAKAAQALHAADRKSDLALESVEEKETRKSLWRRLFG